MLSQAYLPMSMASAERLPGIDLNWFSRVEQLSIGDPPLEVWRRVEQTPWMER